MSDFHLNRTAVLLSGLPRTWRRCCKSHITAFDGCAVDFYLQSWQPELDAELCDAYNTKNIISSAQPEFPEKLVRAVHSGRTQKHHGGNITIPARATAYFAQYCGLRDVYKSIPDKACYNVIVRLRYDVLLRDTLRPHLDNIDDDVCRVPLWRAEKGFGWRPGGMNDHIAIMGRRASALYCLGMFEFLNALAARPEYETRPFHFESNLRQHLDDVKVNVEEVKIPYVIVKTEKEEKLTHYTEILANTNRFGGLVDRNHAKK